MKSFADLDGYFDYPYIYQPVIDTMPNGATIVEVGSWLGKSMAFMAQGLQAKGWTGRLVAVDGFTGVLNQPAHAEVIAKHGGTIRGQFEQNMKDCGVFDMIEIIQGDSAQSAELFHDGSCDFVFIDAAHDYDSVSRDVLAWIPKMRPGAYMAGHDYPWHDVHKAVIECFRSTGYNVFGSCWYKHFNPALTPQDWRNGMKKQP